MADEQQFIINLGGIERYATLMLRMADDELDPFQYRLLGHYSQVCGIGDGCWESVKTTSRITRMAAGMITPTRNYLSENGWIIVRDHPVHNTKLIFVADRWAENMARYAQRSPHEPNLVVTDLSVLNEDQEQQLSYLAVHYMNAPRIQHLIDRCNLLQDIQLDVLQGWIAQYGIERVSECARWYCWQRDIGSARSGGWLRSALAEGWSAPEGWRDDMYLSEEERMRRYTDGWN